MRKIGIIGMGNVGAAVAHQLIASQMVDDLALYDINEAKVNADALDFQDALANLENHVNITVNDWSQLRDAQIIISTLGKISLTMESKSDRFANCATRARPSATSLRIFAIRALTACSSW